MIRTWQIDSVTDAARARIATARVAAAHGVSALDRTRLAAALSGRLRQCLTKGGTWRLTLEPDAAEGLLHAVVEPAPDTDSAGEGPWRTSVPCPEPGDGTGVAGVPDDGELFAEALLGADEDTALVLGKLAEQEDLPSTGRSCTRPTRACWRCTRSWTRPGGRSARRSRRNARPGRKRSGRGGGCGSWPTRARS